MFKSLRSEIGIQKAEYYSLLLLNTKLMKSFAFAAIVGVALAGKYNTIGAPCRIRNPNRAEPRIHKPLVPTNLPETWEW
jgi:hypothetical protein